LGSASAVVRGRPLEGLSPGGGGISLCFCFSPGIPRPLFFQRRRTIFFPPTPTRLRCVFRWWPPTEKIFGKKEKDALGGTNVLRRRILKGRFSSRLWTSSAFPCETHLGLGRRTPPPAVRHAFFWLNSSNPQEKFDPIFGFGGDPPFPSFALNW